MSELNERYRVNRKGLKTVIEELKQRMLASVKVRRYPQLNNLGKIESLTLIRGRCTQNSMKMGQDHVMYHMLKKVKDNHESKT